MAGFMPADTLSACNYHKNKGSIAEREVFGLSAPLEIATTESNCKLPGIPRCRGTLLVLPAEAPRTVDSLKTNRIRNTRRRPFLLMTV